MIMLASGLHREQGYDQPIIVSCAIHECDSGTGGKTVCPE